MNSTQINVSVAPKAWLIRSQIISTATAIAIGAGLIFSLAGNVQAAGVPDQYQQLFDQGKYQPLLSQLNVALAKKAAKTDAADRYSLLMLKGEALLRLKAGGAAEDAFGAAALAGPDANSVAIAKATGNLIKHSGSSKYQPKTKAANAKASPPAIDILDQTSRKAAFAAFLTDLLEPLKPQIASAENVTSLSPIMSLAPQVAEARDVEIAATSADAQSKDILEKLATRAATLMSAALKRFDAQIKTVAKNAAARQKMMGGRALQGAFSSLVPTDADELDSIVSQARQVSGAITQMLPIFGDLGDLKTVQGDAEKIITDANQVLTQYHHPAA